MASRDAKVGRTRSVLVWLVVILLPVVIILVMNRVGPAAPEPRPPTPPVAVFLGSLVLGTLALGAAVIAYLVFVWTRGLTFDLSRPVFAGLKRRLFVTRILLVVMAMFGLALVFNAGLTVAALVLGLSWNVWTVSIIAAAVLANLAWVRVALFAPLERELPRARVRARYSCPEEEAARGIPIGVSDPAKSAWRKGMIEDDVGLLWLEDGQLVYRGDMDGFVVPRERLRAIERETLAASPTAYAGNRHVVLRFDTEDGRERRVRLHVEGCWTVGRVVRATDHLADDLTAWQAAALPTSA